MTVKSLQVLARAFKKKCFRHFFKQKRRGLHCGLRHGLRCGLRRSLRRDVREWVARGL